VLTVACGVSPGASAGKLKAECSVLVVSHDLRELAPLVDCAWEMEPGGQLRSVPWPPQG
jgi:hypothetical protein